MSTKKEILYRAQALGFSTRAVPGTSAQTWCWEHPSGRNLTASFDTSGRLIAASLDGHTLNGPGKLIRVRTWLNGVGTAIGSRHVYRSRHPQLCEASRVRC